MAKSAGICRIRAASRHAHAPLDLPVRANTLRGIFLRSDLGPYMHGGLRPNASFGCKVYFYVKHRFSWVMSGNAESHPRVAASVLILFVYCWLWEGVLTLTELYKNFSVAQERPNDSSDNMGGKCEFAAPARVISQIKKSRHLQAERSWHPCSVLRQGR
jgi:hypothetical protein